MLSSVGFIGARSLFEWRVPETDAEEFDLAVLGPLLDGRDDHAHLWGPGVEGEDLGSAPSGVTMEAVQLDVCPDSRPALGLVAIGGDFAKLVLPRRMLVRLRDALRGSQGSFSVSLNVKAAAVHHEDYYYDMDMRPVGEVLFVFERSRQNESAW
jgi:hypothetical protein